MDPEVADTVIAGYVSEICGRSAHAAGITAVPPVRIIQTQEVHSNVLPGEGISLTAGMFLRAQTEGELAGILAHELAHIYLSHARDANGKILPDVIPLWHDCALAYSTLPQQYHKVRRLEENDRDVVAAKFLTDAGYDPAEMISFLLKLRYDEPAMSDIFNLDDLLELEKTSSTALTRGHILQIDSPKFGEMHAHLEAVMKAVDSKPNRPDLNHPDLRKKPESADGGAGEQNTPAELRIER